MVDNHWNINFDYFEPKKGQKNEFLDSKVVTANNIIALKVLFCAVWSFQKCMIIIWNN